MQVLTCLTMNMFFHFNPVEVKEHIHSKELKPFDYWNPFAQPVKLDLFTVQYLILEIKQDKHYNCPFKPDRSNRGFFAAEEFGPWCITENHCTSASENIYQKALNSSKFQYWTHFFALNEIMFHLVIITELKPYTSHHQGRVLLYSCLCFTHWAV